MCALLADKSYINKDGDIRFVITISNIDQSVCYMDEDSKDYKSCSIQEFSEWTWKEWKCDGN